MSREATPSVVDAARRLWCARVAAALGVAVGLVGLVVLASWLVGYAPLKSLHPEWSTMKANTAFCYACLGAAVLLIAQPGARARSFGRGLAFIAGVFALVTLVQHLGLAVPGFDTLLAPAPESAYPPGRAAPATATMLLTLSIAVACLRTSASKTRLAAILAAALLAFTAMSGYLFGSVLLYATPGFATTAFHTAGCGILTACACVMLSPDDVPARLFLTNTASGHAMRRYVLPGLGALLAVQVLIAVGARIGIVQVPVAQGVTLLAVCAIVLVMFVGAGRHMDRFERDLSASYNNLAASEARFRLMSDSAPVKIWVTDEEGSVIYFNKRWSNFTGLPPEATLGHRWTELLHPDDREEAVRAISAHIARRTPFQIEYRLRRHDGEARNMLATGAPFTDATGEFRGFVGTNVDISEVRQAMDRQALLMRELDHRVKNNLASVIAVAESTFAATHDAASFMEAFRGRVMAMARSHTALAAGRWSGLGLEQLVRTVVVPLFDNPESRLVIEGEKVVVPSVAVAPLAMVLHELGTNSLKHGVCACPGGVVVVRWECAESTPRRVARIEWLERHGDPAPPSRIDLPVSSGLGLSIIRGLIESELGGRVEFRMPPGDFSCIMEFPEASWRTIVRSAEMSRVDQTPVQASAAG